MELEFPASEIRALAQRYVADDATRGVNDSHVEALVRPVRARRYLKPEELQLVRRWKWAPSVGKEFDDDAEYVRDVTALALSATPERLRIEALTLLDGVGWSMASVVLHWFHKDPYPILDYRALSSVGVAPDHRYDFGFWWTYTGFCRDAANTAGVSIRDLDRALWRYSYEARTKR